MQHKFRNVIGFAVLKEMSFNGGYFQLHQDLA